MKDIDSAKYFTQTGSEHVVNDIISKLIFISKVKKGEKLNTKELFVRDNNDMLQRMVRTVRSNVFWDDGENKESTIIFLSTVTNEALNLISIYRKDPSNEFNNNIADLLSQNVENSLQGLESLIYTYREDRIFSSQIETMIDTLKLRVKAFSK
jgi:hypothetical protein